MHFFGMIFIHSDSKFLTNSRRNILSVHIVIVSWRVIVADHKYGISSKEIVELSFVFQFLLMKFIGYLLANPTPSSVESFHTTWVK